jgi:hypothetical protein
MVRRTGLRRERTGGEEDGRVVFCGKAWIESQNFARISGIISERSGPWLHVVPVPLSFMGLENKDSRAARVCSELLCNRL